MFSLNVHSFDCWGHIFCVFYINVPNELLCIHVLYFPHLIFVNQFSKTYLSIYRMTCSCSVEFNIGLTSCFDKLFWIQEKWNKIKYIMHLFAVLSRMSRASVYVCAFPFQVLLLLSITPIPAR